MTKMIFEENEIPYNKFESIGLSQEMVDDLPEQVMAKLLSGNWTPILPVSVDLGDGVRRTIQARVRLDRKEEVVDVLIAPRSEMADLEDFTPEEQNRLRSGKVIVAKMPGMEQCFVQLDDKTNRVMYLPMSLMENNLAALQNELELSNEQVAQMCTGNVLSVDKQEGQFTFGLDFLSDAGLRKRTTPLRDMYLKRNIRRRCKENSTTWGMRMYKRWNRKAGVCVGSSRIYQF